MGNGKNDEPLYIDRRVRFKGAIQSVDWFKMLLYVFYRVPVAKQQTLIRQPS
ncbi:hypothetical protein Oweho_0288 [Owenweeksia hongkongensis DSM 17368]|uniref:Uncharacterized protein n=1 Tax=Owenweeksia hongkongensis (strain DSM 17368 / CIP 108786 / JCM 12287 / NRRL B-23963 / UST20020801) TaxID=926562 RepID=G8R7Y7_OWEHD|nr:hypothetical protein Oweho_0288 [Owenweeksia hongkongensis DSM 17368]